MDLEDNDKYTCKDHNSPLTHYCSNCYKTMCSECRKVHSESFFHFSYPEIATLSKDLPEILSTEVKKIESFFQNTNFQNIKKDPKEVTSFISQESFITDKLLSNNVEFEKMSKNLTEITNIIKNDDSTLRNKIYKSYRDIKNAESIWKDNSESGNFNDKSDTSTLLNFFEKFSTTINILSKDCNILINFYNSIESLNGSISSLIDKGNILVSFFKDLLEMKSNSDKIKIGQIEKAISKLNFEEEKKNKEIEMKIEKLESINRKIEYSFEKLGSYSYLTDLYDASKVNEIPLENDDIRNTDSWLYSKSLSIPKLLIAINLSSHSLASYELSFPIPLYCAIESVKNKAYISGGRVKDKSSNHLYKFDPKYKSKNLIKLADMKLFLSNHSMKNIKGCIYILGGQTEKGITNNCSKYIILQDKFDYSVQAMCENRYDFSVCSFQESRIYVFGGITNRKALKNQQFPVSSIEFLNLNEEKNGWEKIQISGRNNDWKEFSLTGCSQRDSTSILIFGGIYNEFQSKMFGKTLKEIKHNSNTIYSLNVNDNTLRKEQNLTLKRNDFFTGHVAYVEDMRTIVAFGSRKKNYIHLIKLEDRKCEIMKEKLWEIYG